MSDFVARRLGSRMFYGWWIIIAGFGMFMLGGGLLMHAFGAYVKLLEADFGWSRTELSIDESRSIHSVRECGLEERRVLVGIAALR